MIQALNASFFGKELSVGNDTIMAILLIAEAVVCVLLVVLLVCYMARRSAKKRDEVPAPEEMPAETSAVALTESSDQYGQDQYGQDQYGQDQYGRTDQYNQYDVYEQYGVRRPVVLPPIVIPPAYPVVIPMPYPVSEAEIAAKKKDKRTK